MTNLTFRVMSRRLMPSRQQGLTMVELLVAMLISTFIAIAAISALVVARRGFSTVDASSQLRDNGRFASELIQRVAAQAGFLDVADAVNVRGPVDAIAGVTAIPPYIFGFDNAVLTTTAAPVPADALNGNRPSNCGGVTDTGCINGSDILVLRYESPAIGPDSAVSDQSTINCNGVAETNASINSTDMMVSVFHVQLDRGEPTLMCSTQNAAGTWVGTPTPLIRGVESFQLLYGVNGVTPNQDISVTPLPDRGTLIATRYLRASQMVVAGDTTGAKTVALWRRVRSIRIGMVLRGPVNSAQDSGSGLVYRPLGAAMSDSADVGAVFSAPADGRLRQTVTFTVYTRNEQEL